MARDDRAALEQHAGPLGVGRRHRIDLLVDRQRLTGEQRFVDLEIIGHQQTGPTSGAAKSMTSPGRNAVADTVTVRSALRAASSRRRAVATVGTTTRRASWSCSANNAPAAASARSRCAPPVKALTAITPPTRRASTLLPMIADAAAPTAKIGVSGSASSARVADSRLPGWS